MSEFIAEAQVLIIPNAAAFATTLRAELDAAILKAGPVLIPVAAAPVASGAGSAALIAAQEAQTAAVLANTKAIEAQAVALDVDRVAQERAGAASVLNSKAQRINTVRRSQATRAIEAQAASIAGLRGAALTASAPFLAATVAAIAFGKAIRESSNETEELNKTTVVFGASANRVKEFSKTTARSLGISRTEALRAAGVFGNLFRTIKIGEPVAASMSIRLVKLASDLASFNNADPTKVLDSLRSGLVGQARPLRVFGIFLSAARVEQEALIETQKKSSKELTDAEKVQARYNIILSDSAISSNDFANTQGRLANQSRIFLAQIHNLGAELGTVLLPVITGTVSAFNDFFEVIQNDIDIVRALSGEIGDLATEIERSSPAQFVIEIIKKVPGSGEVGDAFKNLKAELEIAAGAALAVSGGVLVETGAGAVVAAAGVVLLNKGLHDFNAEATTAGTNSKQAVQDLFDQFKKAGSGKEALDTLLSGLVALESKLASGDAFSQAFARGILRLIIQLRALGSNPKIEDIGRAIADAIARGFSTRAFVITDAVKKAITFNQAQITGQLQAQVTAVAKAQAFGGSGLAELQRELARIDTILASKKAPVGPVLEQLLNERKSVIGQIKSINDASDTAKVQAATTEAARQTKAIQAFIDTFSPKHQRLENRLASASQFGTAKTQIALNKLIVSADKAEIDAIQARIRHLKLHGDALKLAQATIKTLNQEIFNTKNAILQLQASRKQTIADARQSHLEAQLAIAETTTSTKDDTAAQKALIAFDLAQIKRLKKLKDRGKATRDEIAQLDAYRVDLAQRNQALKDLKGEVVDAGKKFKELAFQFLQTQQGFAANLLGNLIPGFATGGLVGGSAAQGLAAPQFTPGTGVEKESAIAGGKDRGVSSGQGSTQIQLLRGILRALQHLNGRTQHPEARHQKATSGSAMDVM